VREKSALFVEKGAYDVGIVSGAKSTNVKLVQRVNGLEKVKRAGAKSRVIPRRVRAVKLKMINVLR
jgi:hypothetical protein